MGNILIRFGGNSLDGKRSAETFLINVLHGKRDCNSFDELRNGKRKSLPELPPV